MELSRWADSLDPCLPALRSAATACDEDMAQILVTLNPGQKEEFALLQAKRIGITNFMQWCETKVELGREAKLKIKGEHVPPKRSPLV